MNTPTLIPSDAIVFHHNQVRTNTLKVAEAFGREHRNVTAKIKKLDCSDQFLTANFSAVKFEHRGNQYDAYEMTKDGFIFLVMGFTGKKAAQVKEAYIDAFNAMAAKLERQQAKPALPSTLTPAQQRHIQRLVANLANLPGNSFQQVYRSIKDRFNVGSYKDVPADSYPALCKYLGGQPKNDPLAAFQLEQAPLEGDLLTGGTPGPAHELAANYPVTGQHWRHQYRDLMNCGWNDRISTFLFELSKHRGKTIALKVEDVDGLKKEVDSLKHMVESLHMHLERMRTSALSMADEAVWRG